MQSGDCKAEPFGRIDLIRPADRLDYIDVTSRDELEHIFKSEIEWITDQAANQALNSLADAGKVLKGHRAFQRGLELRLQKTWQKALDLFDLARVLSLEFGSDLNEKRWPTASTMYPSENAEAHCDESNVIACGGDYGWPPPKRRRERRDQTEQ